MNRQEISRHWLGRAALAVWDLFVIYGVEVLAVLAIIALAVQLQVAHWW